MGGPANDELNYYIRDPICGPSCFGNERDLSKGTGQQAIVLHVISLGMRYITIASMSRGSGFGDKVI